MRSGDPIDEMMRQWSLRWEDPLRAGVTASILRVQQIISGRIEEVLAPLGITLARAEALILLHFTKTGALPLGKMSEHLMVKPASITSVIDQLERQSLVKRVPHASDRRMTLAQITDEGRSVAEQSAARINSVHNGLGEIPDATLDRLYELFKAFRQDAGDFRDAEETTATS